MSSLLTKIKNPVQFLVEQSVVSKTKPTCDLPFDLNAESASDWLQNLPIDANRTWQLIISAMRSLNESHCEPSTRLILLDILRPVVFLLSEKLQNYSLGPNIPPAKKRKINRLSLKFHFELATGYDLITRSDSFGSQLTPGEQIRVVYRAMRSFSLSLLKTCQMHEPYSSKIWGRLSQLYRIAEARGFSSSVIDETEHSRYFQTSIEALFKAIALFTIINPYRFTRQEMSDIFRLLDQTSDHVHLSSDKYEQGYLASVCVDLERNYPPSLVGQLAHSENNRYFFTWKFEHYLTHTDGKQDSWRELSHYRARLLPRFGDFSCLELSGERRRQQLFQGFNSIYSFLSTSQSRFGARQEHKPRHQNWLKIPDFDLVPMENDTNTLSEQQTFQPAEKSNGQILPAINDGGTEDQSRLGFEGINCFSVRTNLEGFYVIEIDSILEIGQIIAFSSPGEPAQIGSVRWKQTFGQEQHLRYVVELLASEAQPIIALFKSDPGVKLILVNNDPNGVREPSILLPPAKYRCGTVFLEQRDHKKIKYQINKLREFNRLFCQYSISEATE